MIFLLFSAHQSRQKITLKKYCPFEQKYLYSAENNFPEEAMQCALNVSSLSPLIKRSNLTQQYADIYLLQSHSTCFGRQSTHRQEH